MKFQNRDFIDKKFNKLHREKKNELNDKNNFFRFFYVCRIKNNIYVKIKLN